MLHKKTDPPLSLLDDIYASSESGYLLPKLRMPEREHDPRAVYGAIHDELMLDGNSRQNLATFCTTWADPELRALMAECLDKNMIDKDEYPQTAEIEARCVHILADLWNAPNAADTIGCSTTGSSEAAMLGGMALKWRWRAKRQAEGKPTDRPNLITGPVQVCWHKFARYWDVELREIPMDGDRLLMSPEEVIKRCDENTIGVVPTLGVTFTMQYEPVKAISDALDELSRTRGLDVPIHVDAASGGFVAPFIQPELAWDFRLPRVKSINTSGHKFGLAPLGVGWAIWRDRSDLPEDLIFWVNYLGGNMPTFALNFSRPGGQIVGQYYNFLRLGRDGYRKVQTACAETGQFIAQEIAKLGLFQLFYDGRGGLPGCCWTMKPAATNGHRGNGNGHRGNGKNGSSGNATNFTLYDLADRLRTRGWLVPAYPLLPHRADLVVQRVIVRHGFSRDMASLLVEDIKRSIAELQKHPMATSRAADESASYNHGGRSPSAPKPH